MKQWLDFYKQKQTEMKEEKMSIEEITIDHIIKRPNEVYWPKEKTDI